MLDWCGLLFFCLLFFFFQAEDGIRDRNVTGVQTCALPIDPRSDAGEGGPEDPRRLTEDLLVGALPLPERRRGDLAADPDRDDHQRVAREAEPDHAARDGVAPDLRQDVAEDVGEREDDDAGREDDPADRDELRRDRVRGQQARHEQRGTGDEPPAHGRSIILWSATMPRSAAGAASDQSIRRWSRTL